MCSYAAAGDKFDKHRPYNTKLYLDLAISLFYLYRHTHVVVLESYMKIQTDIHLETGRRIVRQPK